jgi:cellulose synthase/poly-beta-1,6-N-acetylglucosamine synthase-like glycosyltransferase
MPAAFSDLLNAVRPHLTPLLVYQIVVSVFVAFALVNAIVDWFTFRRPRPAAATGDGPWPSLSVLVPARDEEATIEACVRSLLAQIIPAASKSLFWTTIPVTERRGF